MDIRQYATGRNCDAAQELVQLFVVLDREGDVPGNDAALLVIARGIAGQFEYFSTEIFQNSGQVHWRTASDPRPVLALTEVSTDATHGELQSRLGRRCGRFLFSAASFSFSGHD